MNSYLSHLDHYLRWCYSEGVPPEDMPTEALLEWMSRPGSPSTVSQRRTTLVHLYESVLGQGFKTLPLPYPKKNVRLPHHLTPQQVARIIQSVTNTKQRLVLQIMYALALRVEEAVRIKREDIYENYDTETGEMYYELRVVGKGNKERRIPIPDQTVAAMFSHIKSKHTESGYLFKGQFKGHYSYGSIRNVFNRAKEKAEVTTPGSTHLLRKSRITHLVNAQLNDRTIMLMVGWKNQKTIEHYHRANTSSMRKAVSMVDESLLLIEKTHHKLIA